MELRSFIKQYIENGGTVLDENFIQTVTTKEENKAKEFQHIANIQVSNLIESVALKSEIEQGFDIADYLIKMDCNQFYIKEVLRDFNYWLKTNTSGGVYSCHGEQFNVSLKHCLN